MVMPSPISVEWICTETQQTIIAQYFLETTEHDVTLKQYLLQMYCILLLRAISATVYDSFLVLYDCISPRCDMLLKSEG